jgi:DNA-binding transcriptional LysR family regulator
MRYLVAVADAGQLTEAARRLGIAQPTLSQALGQLEDQLGVVLLERQPRGVGLTDAGAAFVAQARRVLIAAEEAVAGVRAMQRAGSQALLIGRDGLQPNGWSELFLRLHRERPDAAIEWARLDFPVRGRSPLQHVDVALLTEPPPYPGLSDLLLARQGRVALLSARHRFAARAKVPVGDLLDEVYLGFDPSMDPAWLAFWSLDHERGGPARSSEDRATDLEEAIEIVASGRAFVTAPAPLATALAHPGVVAVPLIGAQPVEVKLVWETRTENPLVETLVALARDTGGVDSKP